MGIHTCISRNCIACCLFANSFACLLMLQFLGPLRIWLRCRDIPAALTISTCISNLSTRCELQDNLTAREGDSGIQTFLRTMLSCIMSVGAFLYRRSGLLFLPIFVICRLQFGAFHSISSEILIPLGSTRLFLSTFLLLNTILHDVPLI